MLPPQLHRLFSSSHTRCILALTLALIVMLAFTRVAATASDTRQRSAESLVKDVLKKLSQREITRIEVYYVNWDDSLYGGMMRDYVFDHYDYKITVADPRERTASLEDALKRLELRKLKFDPMGWEFRLACVFYSGDKEDLRLLFGGGASVLRINDTLFETDPRLLSAVSAFLPHEAYERMYQAVLHELAYIRRADLRRQEEDKADRSDDSAGRGQKQR
jgi:hypothetical protein